MKYPVKCVRRYIAGGLVMLLSAPFGVAASAGQEQSTTTQQQAAPSPLPDNPAPSQNKPVQQAAKQESRKDALPSAIDETASNSTSSGAAATTGQSEQQSAAFSDSNGQQSTSPKPVGTAAAPYEKPTGVAASRPAGAVIAPAKQRRVRSFLIRIGIVVGAGVAIGTVAALSHASPSRP